MVDWLYRLIFRSALPLPEESLPAEPVETRSAEPFAALAELVERTLDPAAELSIKGALPPALGRAWETVPPLPGSAPQQVRADWGQLAPLERQCECLSWLEVAAESGVVNRLATELVRFQHGQTVLQRGDALPAPFAAAGISAAVAAYTIVRTVRGLALGMSEGRLIASNERLDQWFAGVGGMCEAYAGDHVVVLRLLQGLERWEGSLSRFRDDARRRCDQLAAAREREEEFRRHAFCPREWLRARRRIRDIAFKERDAQREYGQATRAVQVMGQTLSRWRSLTPLTSLAGGRAAQTSSSADARLELASVLDADNADGILDALVQRLAADAPRPGEESSVSAAIFQFLEEYREMPHPGAVHAWRRWLWLARFYRLWVLQAEPPQGEGERPAWDDRQRAEHDALFRPWHALREAFRRLPEAATLLATDPRRAFVEEVQALERPLERRAGEAPPRFGCLSEKVDALEAFYLNVIGGMQVKETAPGEGSPDEILLDDEDALSLDDDFALDDSSLDDDPLIPLE